MTKLRVVQGQDPDTDTYWLPKGSNFMRTDDGEIATLRKSLKVEIARDLVIIEGEDDEDTAG